MNNDRLNDLIQRHVDGLLTEPEAAELAQLVANSPEVAAKLADAFRLDAAISRASRSAKANEKGDSGRTNSLSPRERAGVRANFKLSPALAGLAAALLLSAAVVTIYIFVIREHRTSNIEDRTPSAPVATLIESDSTVIYDDRLASEGGEYGVGAYSIESGKAQFVLTSRVTVDLRGKTRLLMHDAMHVSLAAGSAEFVVPRDAIGFTVHLPDRSTIVDLGTAFKVTVDETGQAKLRVTDGRVQWVAAGPNPQPVLVRAGQVARLIDGQPVASTEAIVIDNPSFEDATNTSWQRASDGSNSIVTTSGVIASTQHDTPPDGTDKINHSNGNLNHQVYQVLGTNLAANTTYTLTVDVGDRTDHPHGTPVLRLGTVSGTDDGTTGDGIANDFYGENLLSGTVVANTTPVNGAGDSDGWETWVTTFETGPSPTGLGDPLRVELRNDGGTQALFDNVRLTAVAPTPAALPAGVTLPAEPTTTSPSDSKDPETRPQSRHRVGKDAINE